MKLLITGLCLSRNLGGPAMGITLVDELKKRFSDVDFTFAVESESYEQEKHWADYYGLKIVRKDSITSYVKLRQPLRTARILHRILKRKAPCIPDSTREYEIHREFMTAYQDCDVVIDMMGIAYVGDGVRGFLEGPNSYSNLYYAKKMKKPFAHFIQSFGPFDDWKVRLFAKKDLNYVDFVPARGKVSAKNCRDIVKNPSKVYDFPDIAILLSPAEDRWTTDYLAHLGLAPYEYTSLSPSAVIFNMPSRAGGSIGKEHVRSFYLVARKMINEGEPVLFVPHMYSDNKTECDREICYKVIEMLYANGVNTSLCKIVTDDVDVRQAKALIAKAKKAIVSRYHALVAAISTSVPVVAIGWNVKYFDLMSYYGIESMALDTRKNRPEEISNQVFKILFEYETGKHRQLTLTKHSENVKRVYEAFDLLESWIRSKVKVNSKSRP